MPSIRRGGVLVHPTSLPGRHGAGDLRSARELLAWMERAGLDLWQFLPLGPADAGGSPYNSPSAFARDPLLLSLDDLVADGWLTEPELPGAVNPLMPIDFPAIRSHRATALGLAAARIAKAIDLEGWVDDRGWVDDWALFSALSETHGPEWQAWPETARTRRGDVLANTRETEAYTRAVALQWAFEWQWDRVRREAGKRGIALWGDLPIFVAPSSADTWAHPELFALDADGRPQTVSGVPPDAFSETGQRWGHPHYDLAQHRKRDHDWWKARFAALLELCDCVRIDHFRGLVGVWHIPAGDTDARGGRWEEGLGAPLLDALKTVADPLPVVAEDLGVITDEVRALRDSYGIRGMAVLQFAFGGDDSEHLPHNHRRRQVVYTATHDNDTTEGWFRDQRDASRRRFEAATGGGDPAEAMVRLAWSSVADTAIAPLQDLLGLDGRYRTNTPGTTSGNWSWRVPPGRLTAARANTLRERLAVFGRAALHPPSPSVS